jgi:hypothetical protein
MGTQRLRLQDLPPGEVLIQVAYAAMNYKDALMECQNVQYCPSDLTEHTLRPDKDRAAASHRLANASDHPWLIGIYQRNPVGRGSGLRIVDRAPIAHFH